MAITTPADYVPIGQEEFALGSMPGPLDTILKNTNYLYRYHRPAMLSVAYTSAYKITGRTARFTIPAKPSADGLIYEFTSKLLATSPAAWALTVLVETYDPINGWQNATTATTAQGIMADQLVTDVQTAVIASNVTLLRVSYTGTGTAEITPHHLLAIPTPGLVVTGIKTSGFVPYDDGLLSTTGAVTTEHVNRAQSNAVNILRDRAQCAFAWVQEDTGANMYLRPGGPDFCFWRTTPTAKVCTPGAQGEVKLDCAILAGVTRGTGAVRMQQANTDVGGVFFEAAADGVLHTGTVTMQTNAGGPNASFDAEVAIKMTDPLALMEVQAVVAWWRPTR
jgi:hypothetical protein